MPWQRHIFMVYQKIIPQHSFFKCLKFLLWRSFISLVRFISRQLIVFGAIVNRSASMISFLVCLMLYRRLLISKVDFVPWSFAEIVECFWMFSVYSVNFCIISSANKNNLTLSILFVSLSFPSLALFLQLVFPELFWKRSRGSEQLCLIPDFNKIALSFSPFRIILAVHISNFN